LDKEQKGRGVTESLPPHQSIAHNTRESSRVRDVGPLIGPGEGDGILGPGQIARVGDGVVGGDC